MPTVVTKSIGTAARDYSTIQAWEDAAPANLVTADQVWRGECYNDSEFAVASTPSLRVAGSTSDATRYKELTAAAGQSFIDHAKVRTNLLDYNPALGAAFKCDNINYGITISVGEAYFRTSRLQVASTHNNGNQAYFADNTSLAGLIIQDCILKSHGGTQVLLADCAKVINVLAIQLDTLAFGAGQAFRNYFTSIATQYIACLAIRPSNLAAAGTAFYVGYSNVFTMVSCAVFGYITPHAGCNPTGSKNNATDAATGLAGTNNYHSVPYRKTTPFVCADPTGLDLRPVYGSGLVDQGFLDSTNAPNDITGMARDSSPTIGPWELLPSNFRMTTRPMRPAIFRPMGDAVRPNPYKNWK